MSAKITIITPTTGKNGLFKLIESLKGQSVPFRHILLWDDKREDAFLNSIPTPLDAPFDFIRVKQPEELNSDNRYSVIVPSSFVQGGACGSSLRAVGLMLADTPYVTFADDDVWLEPSHLEDMLKAISSTDSNWAYCRRKIWASAEECIGIDNFESVGDSEDRKVPYEMVDNNCMVFKRRFGTSGAVLYRETKEYNDDRLFYGFLKQHAGVPMKVSMATVNQICPKRLDTMFRQNCTKI